MNLVLILSAISMLAAFFAFVVGWRSRKHKLHSEARWIVLWFLVLTQFHYLSDILEWAGITDVLSDIEDYFEVLIPLLLFLIIYSLLKEQSEKKLHMFKQLVSSTSDHMSFVGYDYVYRTVNKAYLTAHGKTSDMIVGHSITELMGEDVFTGKIKDRFDRCLAGEKVQYRERFNFPNLGLRYLDVAYQPYFSEIGEVAGVVVSSRDITDLHHSERELDEKTSLLKSVLHSTTDTAIVTTDLNMRINFFNPAAEKLFGFTADEVVGRTVMEFHKSFSVAPERLEEALETVRNTGQCDYSLDLDTGAGFGVRHIECRLEGIFNSKGDIVGYSKFARDVTERRQMEMKLRESEQRFHALFDEISDGVAVYEAVDDGSDFVFVDINSAAQKMEGVSSEDIAGHKVTDVFSGVEQFGFLDVLRRVWKTGVSEDHPVSLYEDDKVSYWRKNSVYKLPSGEVVAVYSDETSRRQSEEAMRKSEENYRLLVETITSGIQEVDINGVTVFGNQAYHRLLGYGNGKLIGRSMYDQLEKDEAKRLYDHIKLLIEQQPEPEPWFGTLTKKDGTVIDVQTDWNYKRSKSGEVTGFISVLTDVSQSKRDEEKLKAEHARFVTVMDSLDAIVYVADMQTHEVLFANKTVRKQCGDVTGGICWQVLQVGQTEPCPFCTNNRLLDKNGKPNEPYVWEFQNTDNGRWYQCRDQAIPWLDGRLVRIEIATDINDRKLAEEALVVDKRRLADILQGTNVGTWEWNIITGELLLNERWAGIIGYTLQELSPVTMDTWTKFAHPEDLAKVDEMLENHFSGELEYYMFEARMKHRNGNWIWVVDRGKVSKWSDDGRPMLMSGTHIDITERKLAEEEVIKRERYLNGLNESAQILLASAGSIPFQKFLDSLGPAASASRTYIFMNHPGTQGDLLLSQKAEWCALGIAPEIDNPLLQDLSYDKWLPRWWDILHKGDLINGRVADFPEMEREILDPQNILAILVIPLMIDDEFIGFIGFDNCVSDQEWNDVEQTFLRTAAGDLSQAIRRVRAEKKVRISLREKEVLLREIHHRVKNNMQVVTSLLNLQARKVTDVKALDAIQESQRRIGVISQVHEALYLSGDLSRISMDKYLTGILREITSLYLDAEDSIGYLVDADDLVLSISEAIPVGLVTNELVTNAFKHAFPGDRKGFISITIRKHPGGIVELLVADDGVGMPDGLDIDGAGSLGLQIVYSLVKIQLGGSIEVTNHKGTTFSIKFNQSKDQKHDPMLQGITGSR
ncbi:MAG: PAS domain S-box protein [Candidatus Sabulitectum sp.]|nr:PAS domain S-box protein [Candidatus Sabulitectum sp.]